MAHHRGHCRCEGITISVSGEPEVMVYCHCDDCRRSSGAPLIAAVAFPKAKTQWKITGELGRFQQGTCTRLFCKTCGTPVAQEHESAPELTFFNTAFMDEPERFAPTYHSFEGEQLSWVKLSDELPRYEKTKVIEVAS